MQQGSDPLVGQVLAGTYRVQRILGKGGMGAVYEATHLRLPTRAAIKVLHAETAANREIFARFQREAEITSALRHPNIVQVFDFNHLPDGTPYLIMEYLEGEDLHARLRRVGRLSLPQVIDLVRAVGGGLMAAHKKGVVHRDLKPQNLFLARHEQGDEVIEVPKIVDFGISKIRHAQLDTQQTRDQELLGTPNYMSPEQARGENKLVDHRTDQWALASIVYQCLTGKLAFSGDSLAAIIYQVVLSEPTPVRDLLPDLPEYVEQAIRRALHKDREARFPSVLDFVRALSGQPLTGHASPAGPNADSGTGEHLQTPTPSSKPTTEFPGSSLPFTAPEHKGTLKLPDTPVGPSGRDSLSPVSFGKHDTLGHGRFRHLGPALAGTVVIGGLILFGMLFHQHRTTIPTTPQKVTTTQPRTPPEPVVPPTPPEPKKVPVPAAPVVQEEHPVQAEQEDVNEPVKAHHGDRGKQHGHSSHGTAPSKDPYDDAADVDLTNLVKGKH